ncbi:AAA domain-containing protein [Candidatus Woesearchaeota archaeon]|nr:AAA domain-containing protein [Candidatus Woesearchaeota archaeon]
MDDFSKAILKTGFDDVLGQEELKKQLRSALLAKRHVIIVGPPGVGKTTIAKNVSKVLPKRVLNDCNYHCTPSNPVCPECKTKKVGAKEFEGNKLFVRVQGSPDLTAEDLLGDIDPIKALKYGPLSLEAFTPGKIFRANNGILFFDEVNRCSEKLQNALLQVLQEKKVTIGSYEFDFEADFLFIGTMNPDDKTTEALNEVFLDRFDLAYMEYPKKSLTEVEIVKTYGKKLGASFSETLLHNTVEFVRHFRDDKDVEKHPGVRASIGLYERAQSNALIRNSQKVVFKDVEEAVKSVLAHRIKLKPSVKYLTNPTDFVKESFKTFAEAYNMASDSDGDVP